MALYLYNIKIPTIVTTSSYSQSNSSTLSRYFTIYSGAGIIFLGSQERRTIDGFSVGFGKNSPRLRYGRFSGEQIVEVSLEYSHGLGFQTSPSNNRLGFSFGELSRWRGKAKNGRALFVDIGFGAYFSQRSSDLNSFVSSQPLLDFGFTWKQGGHEWLAGFRYRHTSNAGLVPPNHGQNFIGLFLTYKF